jgi:hypothetical protein
MLHRYLNTFTITSPVDRRAGDQEREQQLVPAEVILMVLQKIMQQETKHA